MSSDRTATCPSSDTSKDQPRPSVTRCPVIKPPSQANNSSSRPNYKSMTAMDSIDVLIRSLDVVLKDTCNNAFRQEIFNLLEVGSSDEAAEQFKQKLTSMFVINENSNED